MLQSALDHYERQQRITAAALVAARRKGLTSERIAQLVAVFQLAAARDALAAVPQMLEEQNLSAPSVGTINPASFAGTASDGRPLESLFEQSNSRFTLGLMVATQIQDAARVAAGVSIASRPGVRYTRMLSPPSCSRCVVLAGREYKSFVAFDRHPGCDCRHIPTSEALAGDLTTDPEAYFDSLDAEGQLKFAGSKGNLRAIQDGADPTQIVNAYRRTAGMRAAGEFPIKVDRGLKFTTEGTTKRALAGRAQLRLRTVGPQQLRLMPESIYKRARSPEDAQRLLKLYGWIL